MVTINVKTGSCLIESTKTVSADIAHVLNQSKRVGATAHDLGVSIRTEKSENEVQSVCTVTLPKNQSVGFGDISSDIERRHEKILEIAHEELQKELDNADKEEQEFCEYSLICELINTLSRAKAVVLLLDRDEKV